MGDRQARALAELSSGKPGPWTSTRLCRGARDLIGVSGAGVMLMSRDVPDGSLCTTDDVSSLIEELQYTLGEGPCVDAYKDRSVVLEPDLAAPMTSRWPAFTPPAVAAGARAVFGFPLLVGAVCLGALNLYSAGPGALTDDQHADALVMADLIAHWVLEVQAAAPSGAVARELERDADFHYVVHNAAGAVSVQLGVGIAEALIRLRARAYSEDRPLLEVAEAVVARRLRF